MRLNIEFFNEKFQFFLKNSQIFKIFKIFEKNRILKKKFQISKCSKKFVFGVMTKQKKLQRDFALNFTI